MSMSVCLSVCLSVNRLTVFAHLRNHSSKLQLNSGRSSVFLWRRWDMLCTSGFVDDVMFARNWLDKGGASLQDERSARIVSVCASDWFFAASLRD